MVQQRDEGTLDFESEHEKVYNLQLMWTNLSLIMRGKKSF